MPDVGSRAAINSCPLIRERLGSPQAKCMGGERFRECQE
jgi:hypothetical protein